MHGAERRPFLLRGNETADRRREDALDGPEAEAVVEATRAFVRLEDLEGQHLGPLLLHMLGGGAKQLAPQATASRRRTHIEQVEEPRTLALAVERRDADVVREQHHVVLGIRVVVAPELVRNLALELRAQLAHERQVVGGRGTDHGVRYWARR